jgi:hypothetical protein
MFRTKDKIIRRWKEYTEELYKKDTKTYTEVQDKAYTQELLVMKSEVHKALWEIAGNKATGVDKLPIELIKAAITALTALCQQIWESNVWPQEWTASKIMLRIIQGRLATYIEREISEEQAGFRKVEE